MYTRDLAGTRFSPLKQINAGNVSKLAEAWTYWSIRAAAQAAAAGLPPVKDAPEEADPFGGGRGGGGAINGEATPIVVNGLMYLPAGRRVVALDPETGKEVWAVQLPVTTTARGVAFWPGDANNPPRIIVTAGLHMVGINANSGKIDPGFGKEGVVDISVGWNGVPTIFKNLILLGATQRGRSSDRAPGNSRAYDARTGKKVWEFHSIPQPGETGFGSWEKDSWKGYSGVNVWGWTLSADEERGILYMPLGSPARQLLWRHTPRQQSLQQFAGGGVDANTGKVFGIAKPSITISGITICLPPQA